jgi:hypothetical protein
MDGEIQPNRRVAVLLQSSLRDRDQQQVDDQLRMRTLKTITLTWQLLVADSAGRAHG